MYSNNGGANWTDLAGSGGTLSQKNIVSVAARGGNLLAAANDDIAKGGGLYYSPNGGSTFSLASGLAARLVFGLAADNSSSNAGGNGTRFFASLSRAATPAANGVYLGDPTKPATWAQVLSLGADRVAKVSTGPGGSVVAAVYDSSSGNPTSGKLVGIYLSPAEFRRDLGFDDDEPAGHKSGRAGIDQSCGRHRPLQPQHRLRRR